MQANFFALKKIESANGNGVNFSKCVAIKLFKSNISSRPNKKIHFKMKNLFSVTLALFSASILFVGCAEETNPDKPKPTLTVEELTVGITNNQITATAGTTLIFRWNAVKAGGGQDLDKFSIAQQGANVISPLPNTANGETLPIDNLPAKYEAQYVDTITIPAGMNLGVTELTFTVTDQEGLTAEVTVSVTVTNASTPLATVKNGMFYHVGGTLQGAYDLVADVVVAAGGANADKDMNNTNTAGNPFTGAWQSENNTQFVKANSFDYANATEEAAATAYAAGTPSASVSAPAVGDIYVAKLRGGSDYTVIKITALNAADNTCSCGNTGKISFEYKRK